MVNDLALFSMFKLLMQLFEAARRGWANQQVHGNQWLGTNYVMVVCPFIYVYFGLLKGKS
ncbi:hypothetical protein HanIR_Chr01g0034271 [Helianthus annuus]|nr:hypothetical protein HanIR_Chr01g0034271 [Helianthus annuus]